jgi:peptidyl-prolyl cis-trans isomerase SurA
MKKTHAIVLALCLASPLAFGQSIDKPVATVRLTKPQAVTQRQLRKVVEPFEERAKRTSSKEERKQVLDSLVNRALLEQAAERDKVYVSDAELKAKLDEVRKNTGAQVGAGRDLTEAELQNLVKNSGLPWEDYLKELRYSILTLNYVRTKKKGVLEGPFTVGEDEARSYYEANKVREFVSDDMVRLRWILIDTRTLTTKEERDKAANRAADIAQELRAGGKFEDLVAKYSDDTSTKYKGGDVGYLARVDEQRKQLFGREFFDAVFALKKGETSGVISSNVGYHIVQVTDRVDAKLLAYDDKVPPLYQITVKDLVKRNLSLQKQNDAFTKALTDIVTSLRKEAEIKVFEDNLSW